MPAVSQAAGEPPDTAPDTSGPAILAAERSYLVESREFLQLMREDVLALKALGGDPVSEEYLKAELFHRAEALKDLPDTPLFFGRLDYGAAAPRTRTGQCGRTANRSTSAGGTCMTRPATRSSSTGAPGLRPFYRASRAHPMGLALRRRFGFSGGDLQPSRTSSSRRARTWGGRT